MNGCHIPVSIQRIYAEGRYSSPVAGRKEDQVASHKARVISTPPHNTFTRPSFRIVGFTAFTHAIGCTSSIIIGCIVSMNNTSQNTGNTEYRPYHSTGNGQGKWYGSIAPYHWSYHLGGLS